MLQGGETLSLDDNQVRVPQEFHPRSLPLSEQSSAWRHPKPIACNTAITSPSRHPGATCSMTCSMTCSTRTAVPLFLRLNGPDIGVWSLVLPTSNCLLTNVRFKPSANDISIVWSQQPVGLQILSKHCKRHSTALLRITYMLSKNSNYIVSPCVCI
jgi:hypothetical protein